MRNRTGNKWNRYSMWLALCVGTLGGALGLLAGCGGGNGTDPEVTPTPKPTASVPTTAKFRVTILWRPRTRIEATGLASALSAKITLFGANVGGGDNVFIRDRSQAIDGKDMATSEVAALPGANYRFRVQFYSQPGGKGIEVGFADTSTTLNSSGELIGTIATYNIGIRKVIVTPGQTIPYNESRDIDFKVEDRDGNLVSLAAEGAASGITYGGAKIIVKPGYESNAVVEANGKVKALKPSLAKICVQIEDKVSDPTDVVITSPLTIDTQPKSVNPLGWQNTQAFTATLAPSGLLAGLSGSDLGVTYTIEGDPGDGSLGTIVSTGSRTALYTAPKADKPVFIIARSNFDPAKFERIPITVRAITGLIFTANGGGPVAGEPGPNKISINQIVDFDAQVTNGNQSPVDQSVTWRLLDGNKAVVTGPTFGTLTTAGVYTAPAIKPTASGRCFIRVTPVYDPVRFKDIPIEIVSGTIGVDIR